MMRTRETILYDNDGPENSPANVKAWVEGEAGGEWTPLFSNVITVTVLDTVTGRTAMDSRWPREWWATGSGACDCNREMLFDKDSDSAVCLGCERYVIIAASDGGDLDELNEDYDAALNILARGLVSLGENP